MKKSRLLNRPQQKGVALLMAVFSMALLLTISIEVSNLLVTEHTVSTHHINRVRAYFAARAGIKMGMLRILLYNKANAAFGEQLKDQKQLLDMIWQMPISWPPQLPPGLSQIDKGKIDAVVKESEFTGQFYINIESIGGKINLNELASENKDLASSTKEQIVQLFRSELEKNEKFHDEYSSFDFEEMVDNIADWIDTDNESRQGGDERSKYPINSDFIPGNQSFWDFTQLKLIPNMTPKIYEMLKQNTTIYGISGINVNYADEKGLRSISPLIGDDEIKEILEYRANKDKGGYFADYNDFISFVEEDLRLDKNEFEKNLPVLLFDAEQNFRITSVGDFKNVNQTIEVITMDINKAVESQITSLDKLAEEEKSASQKQSTPQITPPSASGSSINNTKKEGDDEKNKKSKRKIPASPPTIIYWNEY